MNSPDLPILARAVKAPDPGWTTTVDVVVVGSGIAGLTTALRLRRRVN
ncbi:MAG: FAD-binding protein, partial [Angustibacter sp.]